MGTFGFNRIYTVGRVVKVEDLMRFERFASRGFDSLRISMQNSSFVAIQSRARINLDGHSNCITDTACQLVAQNSRVVTCVQIYYA